MKKFTLLKCIIFSQIICFSTNYISAQSVSANPRNFIRPIGVNPLTIVSTRNAGGQAVYGKLKHVQNGEDIAVLSDLPSSIKPVMYFPEIISKNGIEVQKIMKQ